MIQKRHVAQELYDREIAGIRKQMDETGDRLIADREALSDRLDRVLDKTLKYKKAYAQSQDKLRRSVERIGEP